MRSKLYPPLNLLKVTASKFPNAWEQMRDIHEHNGQEGLPSWEPWCYVPIAAAMAAAAGSVDYESASIFDKFNIVESGVNIAALAPWRLSKEVFVISRELEDLLCEQVSVEDAEIPTEILYQLPYPAFYVQTNELCFDGVRCHGFFVHLEHDVKNGDRELRILFLHEDGVTTAPVPVHIDERTVWDSLMLMRQQGYENTKGHPSLQKGAIEDVKTLNDQALTTAKALQIILYLIAANADVVPDPEQKTIMKQSKTVVKDRYAEIRKWDVGIRIGAAVRRYGIATGDQKEAGSKNQDTTQRSGSPPRPHIRRAHWHHYWTGKMNTSGRKLILKWQHPIAVGITNEELPVTIHSAK